MEKESRGFFKTIQKSDKTRNLEAGEWMGRGLGCCPSKDSGERFVRMGRRRCRMVCVLKLCKPHGVLRFRFFFFGNELESIPSQKVAETEKEKIRINHDQPLTLDIENCS